MNPKKIRALLLSASLLMSGTCLSLSDAAAQNSCVAGPCHATLLKAGNVHPATESCDSCHEAVATPHPQAGTRTFKLAQDQPGLCSTCHDSFGTKSLVHAPVQEGTCTTCHDPHASEQPGLLGQPLKDLCLSCHGEKTGFKHVHGPVSAGDCTACHAPHESDIKALLLKSGDDLCFGCHLDVADARKMKNVHPALELGCTSCHDPHGAEHPKLLAAEGEQLCFQCHDQIGEKLKTAAVVHAPLKDAKGCASCHSPHASDNPKLLAKPGKETCLGCHNAVLTKNMTVLHGPINDGSCVACHEPHASPNSKLLVKAFPPDPYVPYTGAEYALCFTCHNRDLLQYPDTSFATGFRDGERNLHYLHVNNKQKGRSCALCHGIHGSGNPTLIAESVKFGKWNLPLKFVKTETGGGCSPGCHRPLSYDRQTPGRKPSTAPPGGPGD